MSSSFRDSMRSLPLVLAFSLLLPVPLYAEELRLVPALSVKGEYNDNVLGQTSSRRSDFVGTVAPSLTAARNSETATLKGTAGVTAVSYLRDTREGDLGFFGRGNGSARISPRLELSGDLDFTKDPNASYLDPVTAQVVGSKSERQTWRGGGKYRLNEVTRASADVAYSRTDYDSLSYQDSNYYQASAGLEYQVVEGEPGSWLVPQVIWRRDETDLSRVDNLSLTVGASHQVSETIGVSLNAGWRFTRSEFQALAGAAGERGTDNGLLARGALVRSGEGATAEVSLSHTVAPASGQSGSREISEARVSVSSRLTSRLYADLSASYTRSRSGEGQFAAQAVDERAKNAAAGMKYRLSEAPHELALEARYSYHETQYRTAGTELSRNIASLLLTWQHDL